MSAPRTIIGKLNPMRVRTVVDRDFAADNGAEKEADGDSVSVISKQKDLARLDVSDREVRPEDSVSQISVQSARTRRTEKAGSRAGSRRG